MARIRTIKPDFWKHEDLSALPESTHMLAAALLNYADDYGYFNANVGLIRAECFPLREPSVSIHDSLSELVRVGYLELFQGSDGKRYGRVVKFEDHQRVNRPTASKIKPLCSEPETSESPQPQLTELSSQEGKGKGREGKEDAYASSPENPDPENSKNVSREAFSKKLIDDALLEYRHVAADVGLPRPHGTTRQRALIAKILKKYDMEAWCEVVAKIRGSPFLQGKTGRESWPGATLDWICNATNFEKVRDGNYDKCGPDRSGKASRVMDMLREDSAFAQTLDDGGGEPDQGEWEPTRRAVGFS